MKYTIHHFINKFQAIPEELWTTDVYQFVYKVPKKLFGFDIPFTSKELDQRCAQGHCIKDMEEFRFNRAISFKKALDAEEELKALYLLTQEEGDNTNITIASVNNGDFKYLKLGSTPKTRVINYLYNLLEKENERSNVLSEHEFARKKED